ncbi:hypothetical protein V6Z11_D08G263000 [Gossypium hirsutum]|uniref:Chaperone protein DnaJ 1 isoform X3 n=1 Tax=Gossypium hirsutum TaxID=3635 RepID=A0A1U8JNP9_GOSHI|nr:chaperone protein DnaJ 1-like isoform X3 [Gossypium hirsutum]
MEGNHNSTPKDYYKILEVEYDATDEKIRLNYRKLALKWHPDKHKGDSSVTAKFQEINEAYNVLIDPDKRFEYDITGIYEIDKYTLREYLARFKGMILTCNGLGIPHTSIWTQQLRETNEYADDEKGCICLLNMLMPYDRQGHYMNRKAVILSVSIISYSLNLNL